MPSKLSNWFLGLGCLSPIIGIVLLFYFLFRSSIFLGVLLVILSLLVATILFVLMSQVEEKHKLKQLEFLQTFQPDQEGSTKFKSFTSYDLMSKIAIDTQREQIYFWVPDSPKGKNITKAYVGMPYTINSCNYSDILAVKLTEDQHQTAFVQRNSHFTNYLLNKLSEEEKDMGKTTYPPVDKISSMSMEIIIDDEEKPKHLLHFYYAPYIRIQKDSLQYKAFSIECQNWFTILQNIIQKAEPINAVSNIEPTQITIESSICEETLQEVSSKEATQITMDIQIEQYSFHLPEQSKGSAEENLQISSEQPVEDQVEEEPLSYFEQLIEKNRKQMRGDYTDE